MPFHELTENGFQHIGELVPAELLDLFETQIHSLAVAGLEQKGLPVPETEPFAALLKTGGAFRTSLIGNLRNMDVVHMMASEVREKLKQLGFTEWAGLSVPLIYPTLRADPPAETTYLLPWHQDYATQCRKAWRLWIPLRDATPDTGSMSVVRGSHRLGYVEHDMTDPARPHVPEHLLTDLEQITLNMPRGSGVLFDPLLVHASVPARTPVTKFVLLIQVQDLTTLADPDSPDDPLASRLAMTARRDTHRRHS